MSWLYSQALVVEYLGENSSDGEQSAPLSGSNTQQAYCAPDKMTGFSRLSRFGMTFKPLTESRGEELLMSYLAGFHAKTSARQEKAQELTESEAECGEKWRASFAKYDPDMSLWRTHQCSLLGDLEPFSETWPQWGLMRDGECWEQLTLERTIRGTGFGLLGNKAIADTPSGNWPTPTCADIYTDQLKSSQQKKGLMHSVSLGQAVQMWPTPTAHNSKETNAPSEKNRNTPTLAAQAGGKLNPPWVEWLMGWPIGWTDLKPLEMDKSHCAPQQHGESSQQESNNGH
jgi:hypothetical protein